MNPDILPDNPDELKAIIRTLLMKMEVLQGQIRILQKHRFASQSEKDLLGERFRQLSIFGEPEKEPEQAPAPEIEVPTHRRRKPKRRPLPPELPRVEVRYDLDEQEKKCGCGATLVKIGEQVSEKLDIVPAQVRVIRRIRNKYACKQCEGVEDSGPTVKIAPRVPEILPKANATAATLAAIIVAKFVDSLPLYRQEKMLLRIGVEISRSTMAGWLVKVAQILAPMTERLGSALLCGPLINIDETPYQVLNEPGRANTSKSFMWACRGGDPEKPVVLFRYSPTRSVEVAHEILADYRGYVQSDGFSGYEALAKTHPWLRMVGCFAHVRRYFVRVIDARPKGAKNKTGSAEVALSYIQRIYAIEKKARAMELDPEEFCEYRRRLALPVLEKFHDWLLNRGHRAPPGSYLGKAIRYTLKRWDKLVRYLEHACITPDNNLIENEIRPFALGRRNWLFAGHPNGAEAAATYFSLIATARACGLDPYRYIRLLLEKFPFAESEEDYQALLPQNVTEEDLAPYGPRHSLATLLA